jgi:hypothetical protein
MKPLRRHGRGWALLFSIALLTTASSVRQDSVGAYGAGELRLE